MRTVGSAAGRTVQIEGARKLVFCSNNYLSLANHPDIIAAVKKGLDEWGFGPGASRLISGNTEVHEGLERRLARMFAKEACLIFPSGYATNLAVLSTLVGPGDLIAIDKLVHASLIDGAQASGADVRTWPHGQTEKLKRLLQRGQYKQAFVVTDSLFSMDGDRAPLPELVDIKRRYGAMLMVDEAHAFGCIGPEGKGCAAEAQVLHEVDIMVATFSKALGGAGGFVVCEQLIADYLINRARGFIYTTGIPAVNCLAAQAALDVIAAEPQRRERLLTNAAYLRGQLRQMKLDIGRSESYIVPVIIGPAAQAAAAAHQLWERGFMVPAIRPPTVAPASARLRISLMSEHRREDLDGLCEALGAVPAAN